MGKGSQTSGEVRDLPQTEGPPESGGPFLLPVGAKKSGFSLITASQYWLAVGKRVHYHKIVQLGKSLFFLTNPVHTLNNYFRWNKKSNEYPYSTPHSRPSRKIITVNIEYCILFGTGWTKLLNLFDFRVHRQILIIARHP